MNKEFEYLLHLLDVSINQKEPNLPGEEMNWKVLTQYALDHNILPIVYIGVSKMGVNCGIPEELLSSWKNASIKSGFIQLKKRGYLLKLIKAASDKNIPVLLMKGSLLADLYPEPNSRTSIDADLFISTEDFDEMDKVFTSLSYEKNDNDFSENVSTYFFNDFAVELHICMWEDDESDDRFKRLSSLNIDKFENYVDGELNGVPIKKMTDTDMLIYLFFHMVKHFIIKGVGFRYISDITLYVKNKHQTIDWDKFWAGMETLNYTGFCHKFFYLCVKYLSLDPTVVAGFSYDKSLETVAMQLINDMAEGGHGGSATPLRVGTGGVMSKYYYDNGFKTPKKTNLFSFIPMFFRKCKQKRPEDVSGKKYSKNIVVRSFQYFIYLCVNFKNRKDDHGKTSEIIVSTNQRVALVKDLNLFFD